MFSPLSSITPIGHIGPAGRGYGSLNNLQIASRHQLPVKTYSSTCNLSPSRTSNKVREEVGALLAAVSGMDRSVKKRAVALIRQLIKLKHSFGVNVRGPGRQANHFKLDEPIRNFVVGRAGMRRLLMDISPVLANDKYLVDSLKDLVNLSVPGKNRHDAFVEQIAVDKAPREWPREAWLPVLLAGAWDEIDLSEADLRGADLRHVNFPGAILRGVNVTECDFSHANLSGADMESATADGANFSNANLTLLRANGAFFLRAKFAGAIAQDANFEGAHLEYSTGLRFDQGANFKDAELNHAEMGWDLNTQPFRNGLRSSVSRQLKTLCSIHSRHDASHNALVWRLIDAMDVDHVGPRERQALTDILFRQTRCWPHDEIKGFINNVMLPRVLMRWNGRAPAEGEPSLGQVMHYISEVKPALDWPIYCGALSQLQMDMEKTGAFGRRDILSALLKSHPAIAPLAAAVEDSGIGPFEGCSIFMAPTIDCAIVYPTSQLRNMVDGSVSPYNGYFFIGDESGGFAMDVLRDLDTIERCAVPLEMYHVDPPSIPAIKLLSYIFDGSAFKEEFIDALTRKTIPGEIRGTAAIAQLLNRDMQLNNHLEKFLGLRGNTYISDPRCHRLWEIFLDAIPAASEIESNNKDANIARMLVCLGTLFVRYSSSALLGTEAESLNSLRNFAWACVHAAYMFDASLLGKEETDAIGDTLAGKQNSPQCSDILTGRLLDLIRARIADHEDIPLAICFKAIYPQAGL